MKAVRTDPEIETLLQKTEALLSGHFILSSGLHSDRYVQCAKFFQYPDYAQKAAEKLQRLFKYSRVDAVIGGAFGGITIAYELARSFGVRGIFAERVDGVFALRRGFEIKPGENILVAEDVITTGKSIGEVMDLVKQHGGITVGVASLIDRNMPESETMHCREADGCRAEWLVTVRAQAYDPKDCPMCRDGKIPAVKPGSRGLK